MTSPRRIRSFLVQAVIPNGTDNPTVQVHSLHMRQDYACQAAERLSAETGQLHRVFHRKTGKTIYETLPLHHEHQLSANRG